MQFSIKALVKKNEIDNSKLNPTSMIKELIPKIEKKIDIFFCIWEDIIFPQNNVLAERNVRYYLLIITLLR